MSCILFKCACNEVVHNKLEVTTIEYIHINGISHNIIQVVSAITTMVQVSRFQVQQKLLSDAPYLL